MIYSYAVSFFYIYSCRKCLSIRASVINLELIRDSLK